MMNFSKNPSIMEDRLSVNSMGKDNKTAVAANYFQSRNLY